MYLINKLPSLLALIVSVILCFFGFYYKYSIKELSIKLIMTIVCFYFLGYIIRSITTNFLVKLLRENEQKVKLIEHYQETENKNNKFESFNPEKLR